MSSDEITQIKVGQHRMGIIGLKRVMDEVALESADKSDHEVEAELLLRLSKCNYIPSSAKAKYGRAFLREFNKFIGRPVEDSDPVGLQLKVLGPGCPRCNQLEQDLMAVMSEMDIAADIEHVTDITEIGGYGVMGTPALVINSEVKAVGLVPSKPILKKWLQEAFAQTAK